MMRLRSGIWFFVVCHMVMAQTPSLITPKAEKAIGRGTTWLLKQQREDGSWSESSSYRGGSYRVTMTALAGLALLSGGHVPAEGPHREAIRTATMFLVRSAGSNGLITAPSERARSMYGHGFAMLFLAQVYGTTGDTKLDRQVRDVLLRAIRLTAQSQSNEGGWYYTPTRMSSLNDEGSITITQVQALRACANAGLPVPKGTIEKSVKFLQASALKDGSIAYSPRHKQMGHGRGLPAITAAAVAALHNAGAYSDQVADRANKYLLKLVRTNPANPMASFRGHTYYALLYLAQAMWINGDEVWRGFYPPVRHWLIKQQTSAGSWSSRQVGPVYASSIALMTLQLPRRYLPILQR